MENIPPDTLAVVREFLAEGMPHAQIAFMARVSEGLVRRVAAEEQTEIQNLVTPDDSHRV